MNDRQHPRVFVNAPARVRTGSRELKCRIVDLSVGGMAIETTEEDELGRFVRITADFGADSPPIDVDAIVHNKETVNGNRIWGVSFHELSPHEISRIADYVRKRTEAESPGERPEMVEQSAESNAHHPAQAADPQIRRLFEEALQNLGS